MKTQVIRPRLPLTNQDVQPVNEIKVAKIQHHRKYNTIQRAPLEAETPIFLVRYE